MPSRICDICGNFKDYRTHNSPSGDLLCANCHIRILTEERDYWVESANRYRHNLEKVNEESEMWRGISENLYQSVYGERLTTAVSKKEFARYLSNESAHIMPD